jgi:hypothetical protein
MARLEPIVGTNIVDDIRLGQTYTEVGVVAGLIKAVKPEWFVEIGVHEGGLSYLLIPMFSGKLNYFGVEIDLRLVRPAVMEIYAQHRQTLLQEDCFNSALIARISSLPKKIIYCDGGNKVAELLTYKFACHPGDLILTHDYHDGVREVAEVPAEHVHPEVLPRDIQHMLVDDRFVPVDEEILKNTRIMAWRCVA